MTINAEGPESAHVLDAAKFRCTHCGGSKMYISKTIDDPNDIVRDTVFAAYDITCAGGHFQGIVCLCVQCGHEQVPYWWVEDTAACTGAALIMVNLDAGSANTLADLYMIPTVGTNYATTLYSVIASHTANAPTTITLDVASSDDSEDGVWILTNWLPVGWTLDT